MKAKRFLLAGGLLASLVVYPLALQARADGMSSAKGSDGKQAMKCPMPNGQGGMAGHSIEKMKENLGLSDDQVGKIKDVFKDQMNQTKSVREDLKTQTKDLAEKLKAGAKDPELKSILDKIDQDKQDLASASHKRMEALRDILTPTQQAKMCVGMMMHHRGSRGHWKKGADHSHSDSNGMTDSSK
ncbi:MAG: Spy/CpxP family protein refolding chaperone [bacterium]